MENSEQLYYSPCFQCYTSAPFYKSILQELEWVAAVVDKCHPPAREQVWAQLFAMTGSARNKCSKPFSAIVKGWTESATLNLLAIELLYLSFAVALERNANFFTENLPPSCKEMLLEPKKFSVDNLAGISQTTSKFTHTDFKEQHKINGDVSYHDIQYLGESSSQKHFRNGDSNSFAARLPPISSSVERVDFSQGMGRTEFSHQWTVHTVNPYYHQPQSIPVTSNLNELQRCREKLSELYNCKSYLDALPEPTKRRIWDSLALSSSFTSFASLINFWAQDLLATNAHHISKLYSLVEFLQGGQEISSIDLGKSPLLTTQNAIVSRTELFSEPVSLPAVKITNMNQTNVPPQTITTTPCQPKSDTAIRQVPDNRMCIMQILNS